MGLNFSNKKRSKGNNMTSVAPKLSRILLMTACAVLLTACGNANHAAQISSDDAPQVIATVFDFNGDISSYSLETKSASAKIIDSSDRKRLAVNFDDDVKISAAEIVPDTPLDWSEYKNFNIAVDLENPSDKSIYVYMGFHDSNGDFHNKGMNVPASSKGTYYVILDGPTRAIDSGMREMPAPWNDGETMMIARWTSQFGNFDFSSVAKIEFFTRGIIGDRTVQIDNVRLRKNKALPDDYLKNIIDKFGQNAKADFPIKVSSETELKMIADAELRDLKANPGIADRSKFGGWKDGPKFDATGYFRTEKIKGKWWMVDPEGYLFFSHGVANVRMANLSTMTGIDFKDDNIRTIGSDELTPEDSIGVVKTSQAARESRFVKSKLRHDLFEWLPDYDDPLAAHYSYRRSTLMGPLKTGETYNFYRANLQRRYGETSPESYMRKWEQVTLDRMNSWGFTSFGNWVDPAFYPNEQVPYFANGWIIGDFQTLSSGYDIWGPAPDFFDPEFAKRANATISQIAEEIQGSPWCVGIFIDNEKSWGNPDDPDEKRYGLVMDALSKDGEKSYAKAEFTKQLNQKYKTIAALNKAWATNFSSWDEFDRGFEISVFNNKVIDDLSTLFEAYSEQYFKVVSGTIDRYLPKHLYMGARMASWGMPKETIKAAIKYSDVMSFNIYEEGLRKGGWDFFADIDKPVVIGEFHIGAQSDTGVFHPGLVMAANQADRAEMYKTYMKTVTNNPYLVGAHWFQYVDSPISGRAYDGENYNVGFVSNTDIPYPEMVETAREIMTDLYPSRYNNVAE